jgi:hypothetical protein
MSKAGLVLTVFCRKWRIELKSRLRELGRGMIAQKNLKILD